jgi:S-disulfanyl-L-cysteine oxidoreductase SoxD
MMRARAFLVAAAVVACSGRAQRQGEPPRHYGVGRPATAVEIAQRDVDVGPDGVGLPVGSGTVAQGASVFSQKCAVCHGAKGEGQPPMYPALVGRDPAAEHFVFGQNPNLKRTIGNYWPYATTVFDYIRRAMPLPAPGSLTNDELYAVTAYLLAANQVIPMTASLDATSLAAVKMPYVDRFVKDNRRGGHEVR